ncbi:MAG TPA: helix-turn-helix domain-containing protein [Azospirillaceae bacterium]|nr:helix-turn-helix domain-containing protein [Azospirillaceae bacterium]
MSPIPNAAPTGRRERKLAQTARHIAERAWELFEQFGYEQVSMEVIANVADVARGTLYKHFPTKEALVAYRFQQDQVQGRPAVQEAASKAPNIVEAFHCVLRMEATYAERNRTYVGPYVFYRLSSAQQSPDPFENDDFAVLALQLIRQGQDDGVISTEMNAHSLAENLIFLRLGAMLRWLREPGAVLVDLYAGMLNVFFQGALRRPQPE